MVFTRKQRYKNDSLYILILMKESGKTEEDMVSKLDIVREKQAPRCGSNYKTTEVLPPPHGKHGEGSINENGMGCINGA